MLILGALAMKTLVHRLVLAALALSGVAQAGEAHLTVDAPVIWEVPIPFWEGHSLPVSNSMIMLTIAVIVITLILRLATRRMERIPHGLQNFIEWIFETLYNFVEGLTGKYLARKYFWYFATVFILILVSNLIGLLPGVGEITYQGKPLFRGANADMNTTVFLGFFYAILWFVWVMREQGPIGFIKHTFGPKGGLTGVLKYALLPIFFFVGLIEIVSICIRPVALAARLYGNIFAGETVLEVMTNTSFFATIPFMALELLVAFVQALVFLMLTAVFLQTQVGHEEEEENHA